MKKKAIMIATVTVLTMHMATSAFAAAPTTPTATTVGYGLCGSGYGIMRDQAGNFLDKEAFEANLDQLIEDGYVRAEDRDYFLAQYDWCATYGSSTAGVRGGRGMGRGMGCGLGRGW